MTTEEVEVRMCIRCGRLGSMTSSDWIQHMRKHGIEPDWSDTEP